MFTSTRKSVAWWGYFWIFAANCVNSLQWDSSSILPTDLVGAQIGIWKHNLHLINGLYNGSRLNLAQTDNNKVLWLKTNLSQSISVTATNTSTATTPTVTFDPHLAQRAVWDILVTTNSLGGFLCYAKCSTQIGRFLYVVSAERLDSADPNGLLIVYDLETQQLLPPPLGLTDTPYYVNGGACVVHNDTHLFSIGGYHRQCPINKLDPDSARCTDPTNILIYDTLRFAWSSGAPLPLSARVDAAACAMNVNFSAIYTFGGYNKFENALSDQVHKYDVGSDSFDADFAQTMRFKRSELNAVVDRKHNHAYLIGGAVDVVTSTGRLIEVYDMTAERFIDVTLGGLPMPIRWYGSAMYDYDANLDILLVVGGHAGDFVTTLDLRQNMTDLVQYLTLTNASDPYTDFPTNEPTASPTHSPTDIPTLIPTGNPTIAPSNDPTKQPTLSPTPSHLPFRPLLLRRNLH